MKNTIYIILTLVNVYNAYYISVKNTITLMNVQMYKMQVTINKNAIKIQNTLFIFYYHTYTM